MWSKIWTFDRYLYTQEKNICTERERNVAIEKKMFQAKATKSETP